MARHNKNSATEDAIGVIHKTVTRCFQTKLDLMLAEAEKSPEDALFILDDRSIAAAAKWCEMNEVSFAEPQGQEGNPLRQSLAAIKEKQQGRVIAFTEEKERQKG